MQGRAPWPYVAVLAREFSRLPGQVAEDPLHPASDGARLSGTASSMSVRKRSSPGCGFQPRSASIRLGFAAIAFGSEGRMNAGSTTDGRLPGRGEAGRPGERVVAVELPFELEAPECEGAVGELPDRVQLARAEHVVAVGLGPVGDPAPLGLAEDREHPLHVVGGEAPVALCLQVSERQGPRRRSRREGPARGRRPSARGTSRRGAATRG